MDTIAPTRPRRSTSFWVAWLLAVLLGMSGLFNLGIVCLLVVGAAATGHDAPQYDEVLLDGEESQTDKVVVIPLHGEIVEETGDRRSDATRSAVGLHALLRHLKTDKSVKAVILDVDSPGGGVTASDEMYHDLKAFKQATNVPIVALFGDVAASGGYYASMSADEIVAHGTTITGSIGVISHFPNLSGLMDKVGVKMEVVKSLNSAGGTSMKDIGSPYRPMTPDERKVLQDLITAMWQRFVSVVQEGRKGRVPPEQVPQLADGRVFSGSEAMRLKLVDSLGYEEDAWKRARSLGHCESAKVVRIRQASRWYDVFGSAQNDAVGTVLNKWADESPRLLYLWSGH